MKFMDKLINSNNFDDLSAPIDDVNPVGISIEYDARFLQLQQMVEGKAEQEYGDTIIPAEEPDWKEVTKLCVQLLSESKDLYIFGFYIQALTAQHGIEGFCHGCKMMLVNLQQYWDDIYPSLYEEDTYDAFFRVNSISLLTSRQGVLKQLYDAKLNFSDNNRISISFKDAVNLLSNGSSVKDVYAGGETQLITDMKVASGRGNDCVESLKEARLCIEAMESFFQEKLPDEVVDFSVILAPLKVFSVYGQFFDESEIEIDRGSIHSVTDSQTDEMTNFMNIASVKISNRKEVEILLEKVCLYFATYEPSHPAPLFVKRAQKTMNMNFYEIMKDVSPQSLKEVEKLFGKLFEEDENT